MCTELTSYAYTVGIVVDYLIIAYCMCTHVFAILSMLCDNSLNPLQYANDDWQGNKRFC